MHFFKTDVLNAFCSILKSYLITGRVHFNFKFIFSCSWKFMARKYAKCEIILILSHNVCSNGKLGVWILEVRSQLHKLLLISSRQSSPSLLYLHWPIMKQIHKVHKDDSQKSNACYNIAISIVFRLLTCRTPFIYLSLRRNVP